MEDHVRFLVPTDEVGIYTSIDYEEQILYGVFIFAFVRQAQFPNVLRIKAIHNDQEEYINLQLMQLHFYRGEVENIGTFYFSVENIKDLFMLQDGNRVPLSILTPINTKLFESACERYRFFFVGE